MLSREKLNEKDLEVIYKLLHNEDYASAYLLLKPIIETEDISIKYNYAICMVNVNKYNEAKGILEDLLYEMKSRLIPNIKKDDIYISLLEKSEQRYLKPMLYNFPKELGEIIRENITRLLIDVYYALNEFDRILSLSVGLEHFDNVKNILKEIK